MVAMVGVVAIVAAYQTPPAPVSSLQRARELREELKAIEDRERTRSEELVASLKSEGKEAAAAAASARILAPYSPTAPESFLALPEFVAKASPPETPPEPEGVAIRDSAVKALLALASRASAPGVGRFSLADRCLREALRRDPDHAEARRLLGYVPTPDGWATPFALEQLKAGKVRHPIYGWVPKSWSGPLDAGKLPGLVIPHDVPNQWLPADEADALRASFFDRPWSITTPHFELRTNAPLREAIAFERRLEQFHDVFFSLLGDVIGRDRLPLAQRLASARPAGRSVAHRYEVWYFAERPEYADYFRRKFHKEEDISLGYFMPPSEARAFKTTPRSYFFRDPNPAIDTESTLFHEASHQLLFESAGSSKFDRNPGNHWVWEGLGTYFETVRVMDDPDAMAVGEPVGPRMEQARLRLVERGELIPIRAFVALDRAQFEASPGIYLHYAEAMALTLFLMHGENGRYRDGFLDYVRTAYDGRLSSGRGLDHYLDTPYEQLDGEFLRYLAKVPAPGDPQAEH
jgi:hypothetical protein